MTIHIESLLSARLFMAPHRVGDRIYFISNMSGRMSLYGMDATGSVPEPLLPPDLALQNPELIGGHSYYVFPALQQILVMVDHDGDENYQPMLIPVTGGYPEPAFGDQFANYRVSCTECDPMRNIAYFRAASRKESVNVGYRGNLVSRELLKLAESKWGAYPVACNDSHTKVVIAEGYTFGDDVLRLWTAGEKNLRLLYGKPLEQRAEGEQVPLTGFGSCAFTDGDRGLVVITSLFDEHYGLGYIDLANTAEVKPVPISGLMHSGEGELVELKHLERMQYRLTYNIDGSTWSYRSEFDEAALKMSVTGLICGQGALADGVVEGIHHDSITGSHVLAFSTAISPTQLYTIDGQEPCALTRERVLGVPQEWLSPGEDASFTSHDGLRISARLYLPAPTLGFQGPRPLVYYVHGGPQSQERPNFAWFSMPLIQFLAMNGFAVFVPNVRGSSGYGMSYMKWVDRDWGGQDRLDHVHAMTEVLPKDARLDVKRAAVVGRSYGGYMTLTLAGRHPELWKAACDMFGPYNLLTFMDRIPETWKPYFAVSVGDPAKDRDFLLERSPYTYVNNIACPLLVIQGKNDPRVIEQESREVVEQLRGQGKTVEYLMFENEGHDVLKYENRVRCYNTITDFFKRYLM